MKVFLDLVPKNLVDLVKAADEKKQNVLQIRSYLVSLKCDSCGKTQNLIRKENPFKPESKLNDLKCTGCGANLELIN